MADEVAGDPTVTGPTFDQHGYPTEATLDRITNWPLSDDTTRDMRDWLAFCQMAWHYPEAWTVRQPTSAEREVFMLGDETWLHYCATGGWSGNESVIGAMAKNFVFWSQTFVGRATGGAYWFTRP